LPSRGLPEPKLQLHFRPAGTRVLTVKLIIPMDAMVSALNRLIVDVCRFHPRFGDEIVGSDISIFIELNDLLVLQMSRVNSNYIPILKQIIEVIVDGRLRDYESLVKFDVSMNCSWRKSEVVLGEKTKKHALSLAFTHISIIGGIVSISSESAVFPTISPVLSLDLHMCTNKAKLLSGCPLYTTVDHALGSHRVHNEKSPGLPNHREPSVWSQSSMYSNDRNRFKSTGTLAAQTPSSASAPDQIEALVGADTPRVTATNQSPSPTAGGGWHVPI